MTTFPKEPLRTRIPLQRAQRWVAERENVEEAAVQVFVKQTAFRDLWKHANSDMDHEVGGWLVGHWCWDKQKMEEFVVVEAVLPAADVQHSSTYLTFTQNSQLMMLAELEEEYPEMQVMGWYHTHPRMGLFLSGYDVWLHDHFFPHPWQVALVIDPHSCEGGFFVRDRDHELNPNRYHGFFEMHKGAEESVVPWKNLRLNATAQSSSQNSTKSKATQTKQQDPAKKEVEP